MHQIFTQFGLGMSEEPRLYALHTRARAERFTVGGC
jgi:hypothetical protein